MFPGAPPQHTQSAPLSKQAAAMAAVDAERNQRAAANARANNNNNAAASSNAAAGVTTYFTSATTTARSANAQSSSAAQPTGVAAEYPQPPTDTRKLLAFLLRQDYGCHGPLLARSGKSASGSAQAAGHFFALKVAEEKRRKSMAGAVAAAKQGATEPPLPDSSFALLRPSMSLPSTASIDSVLPDRLHFFTGLHAYRFEQTQQMSLATLVEYYSSIWEEVSVWSSI